VCLKHRIVAKAPGCNEIGWAGVDRLSESVLNRLYAICLILFMFVRLGGLMTETATFGAGCFWGVEAEFRRLPGVIDAAVGYSGGHTVNPTYKDVCTDETGHAEVVQVTFDPAKISYEQLLGAFWQLHDPTQVNRQGPDFGTQYRTAIFFHSPEQEAAAKKSKAALDASGKFRRPIATEITPAGPFYRAEEYHQRYLEKRGAASCHI
jgi:peptide-methionine (S)-S-oxide reductase